MSRLLDDLDPRFRPQAIELLARLTEAGIAVMIVQTLRSQAEQDQAVKSGHSWVPHSKHQDGLAMDVCVYDEYLLHGPDKLKWSTDDVIWDRVATIAEMIGLRSGYRWKQRDAGHVELPT